jgi:hypothetical protein
MSSSPGITQITWKIKGERRKITIKGGGQMVIFPALHHEKGRK